MSAVSVVAHSGVDHLGYLALGAAGTGLYVIAWNGLTPRSRWRLAAWLTGVVALLVASSPPVERAAERSFTGHMVQHLIMIIVAAPALVVSHPVAAALRSGLVPASRSGRRLGAAWLRVAPAAGPALLIAVLYITHLTAVYDRALGNRWIHDAEHAGYLIAAVATWSALLAARRASAPARVAGVFAIIGATAMLSMIMMSADTPLVPGYATLLGTAEALDDQQTAAAMMWVTGMATTLPLLVASVWRWAATEERIARRQEAILDGRS